MGTAAAKRKGPILALAVILCASFVPAAEKGSAWVVVHLKSGAKIRARLVAEDERSVTIATKDGEVRLARSTIERIDGPASKRPTTTPRSAKRVIAERPRPEEKLAQAKLRPWPEAEEQEIDDVLNRFFAAKDEATRKAIFTELEKTRLERRLEELERMREVGAKKGGLQRHAPVPWRRGAKRGWYNIAIPPDYTPASAWPLVLALHGMPSNGDNLVRWYASYFPRRGYIVLFPTTIRRSSFWPAPSEKRELLRLLQHICRSYRIDYRRVYCTGASGGGIGTWHWLVTLPELFGGGISFSAAGTIFDKRLQKLKGLPFYVHHGTKDHIPTRSVERSVAMARKWGANIEFYASKGTGHTPPRRDWHRAFDWLVKLPPNEISPRYLLECPEGALPIGYRRYLPFAVAPDRAALARIYAGYKAKAAKWQIPSHIPPDDLIAGMVLLAKIIDPGCDLAAVRREVKRIADAVRKKVKSGSPSVETLYVLNEVFFQTEGFTRDGSDPTGAKPEGLAIHRVLKSRMGNVFTLTGIYVAVATELGLPVAPVVSPYHAFARYDDGTDVVNVEMTEAGGHFDDAIYKVGYGLAKIPTAKTLKERGAASLLAAQLAVLSAMASKAGTTQKAKAAAQAALDLDRDCYGALYIFALAAREKKQPKEALKWLGRLAQAWPDYAAPRLSEGEIHAQLGSRKDAVGAYREGIRAKLKPYGAAPAFDAELYYRIAEIYAAASQEARKAKRISWVNYYNKCNRALLNSLKLNPHHRRARELLIKMGGKIISK